MTASASRTAPPNPKPERINPQQLDRPTQRGTYLQPGSILDENPGSDLSGNQHSTESIGGIRATRGARRAPDNTARRDFIGANGLTLLWQILLTEVIFRIPE